MTAEIRSELSGMGVPQAILTQVEAIQARQSQQLSNLNADDLDLLGQGGYVPPHPSIIIDALVAISLGKNVLLKGPTGAGKTKLAEFLSHVFRQPMQSINCSVDLDAEALLGFKTLQQDRGQASIEFVEGPVIRAMKQGQMLYIDEVNMAKPETLPILNGVLDYRRRITNPFTGQVVKAQSDFRVVAAINVGYVGTVPLNEALKNRFVVIDVPYLQGADLRELLSSKSNLKTPSLIDGFVQLSADIVHQVKEGHLPDEAASIRALIDACDLSLYIPPLRAVERAIVDKLEDDREKRLVFNLAETMFGAED